MSSYPSPPKHWSSGNLRIIQRLVSVMLFKLVRVVFTLVQSIYWRLNGTAEQVRAARDPANYERSAHVLDVLLCHKFCEIEVISVRDFICTHNRFDSPQYVFDNDHINLMTVTDTHAVFCEPPLKGSLIRQWRVLDCPWPR